MGQTAKNAEFTSEIVQSNDTYKFKTSDIKPSDYLLNGDEVFVTGLNSDQSKQSIKAWVVPVSYTHLTLPTIRLKKFF